MPPPNPPIPMPNELDDSNDCMPNPASNPNPELAGAHRPLMQI
jgi:hypothetical protein